MQRDVVVGVPGRRRQVDVVERRAPRQEVRQQDAVVGAVGLGAEDGDRHPVLRVAGAQLLDEAGAGHAVADDDHLGALHAARSTRTAQTLNSGIFEIGSSAGLVTRFALPWPPQWNGMNTVSERIVAVTRAAPRAVPRRLTTRTGSPPPIPSRWEPSGCSSTKASGAAADSAGIRRVCAPLWYCARTRPVVRYSG